MVHLCKKTCIVDFYFCCHVEMTVTFFLLKAMIEDWVWYWYKFQILRSVHAHGMMKLKLSPYILYLVSIVYSGRKSIEMLQYAVEYHEMSAVKKKNFSKHL